VSRSGAEVPCGTGVSFVLIALHGRDARATRSVRLSFLDRMR
jgi:hypothetical protein